MSLHRNKRRKAFLFCQRVCFGKLIGEAVGYSDIACFSGADDAAQSLHDVVERRSVVPHMIDVEVHVVHAEVFQALVQHALDVLYAGNAGCDLPVRARQDFCGDYDLAAPCKIAQRASQILLACAVLVRDGGIKKVDSEGKPPFYDFAGDGLVCRPGMLSVPRLSEAHAAHADTGYGKLGASQLGIFHFISFSAGHMDRLWRFCPF